MEEQKKKEMILEVKDIEVVDRFFKNFKLNKPDYLVEACENFEKDQNLKTEEALKLAITKASIENEEDIKKLDELFAPVLKACGEMAYNLQFDKDLVDVIGTDDEAATPELDRPQSSEDSEQS